MLQLKYLNLLALAVVAILAISSAPPANALVADRAQVARHVHAHHAAAKRRRDNPSGQCRQRNPVDLSPTPTPSFTPSPSPTTTSTTSSPAPSPTNSGSSGKFGLAWANGDTYLENFANFGNVGFLYTWNPVIPESVRSYPHIKPMTMLWGFQWIDTFKKTVYPGYAQYAMGVNEPNESSQAFMDPGQGLDLWMTYINPLQSQGYILVSPACTNDGAGLDWYKGFMALCSTTAGCKVDIMAFHAYTNNASEAIDYANTLHNLYNLPIMITEFADQDFSPLRIEPDTNEMWDFAGQMKTFIEETDWIVAGFPFAPQMDLKDVNTQNALMDPNGYPTSLAYYYFK